LRDDRRSRVEDVAHRGNELRLAVVGLVVDEAEGVENGQGERDAVALPGHRGSRSDADVHAPEAEIARRKNQKRADAEEQPLDQHRRRDQRVDVRVAHPDEAAGARSIGREDVVDEVEADERGRDQHPFAREVEGEPRTRGQQVTEALFGRAEAPLEVVGDRDLKKSGEDVDDPARELFVADPYPPATLRRLRRGCRLGAFRGSRLFLRAVLLRERCRVRREQHPGDEKRSSQSAAHGPLRDHPSEPAKPLRCEDILAPGSPLARLGPEAAIVV